MRELLLVQRERLPIARFDGELVGHLADLQSAAGHGAGPGRGGVHQQPDPDHRQERCYQRQCEQSDSELLEHHAPPFSPDLSGQRRGLSSSDSRSR
ncbi:Uncharacterised protein [Mycobacteroides abscessus subsp. abscessus]|nr:Uncharacterised protein [Mycobacteroides abscessus subsp. abscessus]